MTAFVYIKRPTTFQEDLALLRRLFSGPQTAIGTVIADHALDTVQPQVQRGWLTLHTSTWVSGGMIALPTREGKRVLIGATRQKARA